MTPWLLPLVLVHLMDPSDDLKKARRALAAGDLVGWSDARRRSQVGPPPQPGAWGRLDDLAALLRCRPLPDGPGPAGSPRERALHGLLRLEAERLRRHLIDGAHARTDLPKLVAAAPHLRVALEHDGSVVRWPIEEERWPGERFEPSLGPSACASVAALESEGPQARLEAERRALRGVVRDLEGVPPRLVGAVASAWYDALEASPEGLGPERELREGALVEALLKAPAGALRDRALVLIVRRWLDTGAHPELGPELAAIEARSHGTLRWLTRISRVLASPSRRRQTSAFGDLEPPYVVRAWLDHVQATTLFEAQDLDALQRFGRGFLRRRGSSAVDAETFEMLLDALLSRSATEALSMAADLGDRAPSAVRKRWWSLGLRALERGQLQLAREVLDRLWFEAAAAGSDLPAELPMILAARARVALARLDAVGFEGLAVAIEASASRRQRRRAVLALAQDAVARLAAVDPGLRRSFSARTLLLLETAFGSARLPREAEVLARWGGRGTTSAPLPSRQRTQTLTIPLGEARVARSARALPPPGLVLGPQSIPSFLVWETPEGTVRYGLPPRVRQLAEKTDSR